MSLAGDEGFRKQSIYFAAARLIMTEQKEPAGRIGFGWFITRTADEGRMQNLKKQGGFQCDC